MWKVVKNVDDLQSTIFDLPSNTGTHIRTHAQTWPDHHSIQLQLLRDYIVDISLAALWCVWRSRRGNNKVWLRRIILLLNHTEQSFCNQGQSRRHWLIHWYCAFSLSPLVSSHARVISRNEKELGKTEREAFVRHFEFLSLVGITYTHTYTFL